jgi:hypothetical protein
VVGDVSYMRTSLRQSSAGISIGPVNRLQHDKGSQYTRFSVRPMSIQEPRTGAGGNHHAQLHGEAIEGT